MKKLFLILIVFGYSTFAFSVNNNKIDKDIKEILIQTAHEGDISKAEEIEHYQEYNKLSDSDIRNSVHRLLNPHENDSWMREQIIVNALWVLPSYGDASSTIELKKIIADDQPFTNISATAYRSLIVLSNFDSYYVSRFIDKSLKENKLYYCVPILSVQLDRYNQANDEKAKKKLTDSIITTIKLLQDKTDCKWINELLTRKGLSLSDLRKNNKQSGDVYDNCESIQDKISTGKNENKPIKYINTSPDLKLDENSASESEGAKLWLILMVVIAITGCLLFLFKRMRKPTDGF